MRPLEVLGLKARALTAHSLVTEARALWSTCSDHFLINDLVREGSST